MKLPLVIIDDKMTCKGFLGGVKMEIIQINEQSLMIYFKPEISEQVYGQVASVVEYIKDFNHAAITEIIPSYRAVMLHFDFLKASKEEIIDDLKLNELDLDKQSSTESRRIIHIPVVYGGAYGPDIENVAQHHDLSVEDVIKRHTENAYLVYMLGFLPGFPFLGGLDEKLHTPRREEPRLKIDAGSVGIANNQTGLYPLDSPGGWQIIGRTPIDVFNQYRKPMCVYEAGDKIQFYEITESQFKDIKAEIEADKLDYSKWVVIKDDN